MSPVLDKDPLNIVITGVGGQGNVLASQLLGHCLVRAGYVVTIGETYGASQRGGSVMSHLRISQKKHWAPLIPEGRAHVVMGLEPMEGLRVMKQYGNPGVLALSNIRPIYPLDVIGGQATYPKPEKILERLDSLCAGVWTLAATDIALELNQPVLSNLAMLGGLSALGLCLPLSVENLKASLEDILPAKAVAMNLEAFQRGEKETRRLDSN